MGEIRKERLVSDNRRAGLALPFSYFPRRTQPQPRAISQNEPNLNPWPSPKTNPIITRSHALSSGVRLGAGRRRRRSVPDYRGRESRLPRPPLPPNRAGGFPAHGSPVGGLTSKRIDVTSRGHGQFQQPRLGGQEGYLWTAPREEGRQQPCRSLRRFEPRHVCVALSGTLSPYKYGQSDRGFVRRLELHVSTFLHPFAPPALPGFNATMGALTPARRVLRIMSIMNARLVRAGLSASCAWPSVHSASKHPTVPHDRS
jgi:hypothetical protein